MITKREISAGAGKLARARQTLSVRVAQPRDSSRRALRRTPSFCSLSNATPRPRARISAIGGVEPAAGIARPKFPSSRPGASFLVDCRRGEIRALARGLSRPGDRRGPDLEARGSIFGVSPRCRQTICRGICRACLADLRRRRRDRR